MNLKSSTLIAIVSINKNKNDTITITRRMESMKISKVIPNHLEEFVQSMICSHNMVVAVLVLQEFMTEILE